MTVQPETTEGGERPWTIKNIPAALRQQVMALADRNGETYGAIVTRALVELVKERPRGRDLVPLNPPANETPTPALPVEELRALAALAAEMNGGAPARSVARRINKAIRARLDEVLR